MLLKSSVRQSPFIGWGRSQRNRSVGVRELRQRSSTRAHCAVAHRSDPVEVGLPGGTPAVGVGDSSSCEGMANVFPGLLAGGPHDDMVGFGAGHLTPVKLDLAGSGGRDQPRCGRRARDGTDRIRPSALCAVDHSTDPVVEGLPGREPAVGERGSICRQGITNAKPLFLAFGPHDEMVAVGAGHLTPAKVNLADGEGRRQRWRGQPAGTSVIVSDHAPSVPSITALTW